MKRRIESAQPYRPTFGPIHERVKRMRTHFGEYEIVGPTDRIIV